MAWQGQTLEAASWSWSDPLPGPSDMHRILDPMRQAPQGPGVDMGHVFLWQAARRWYLPLWLVWSMLMQHPMA